MAKYFEKCHGQCLVGKRVLEIGAGAGLLGVVMSLLGFKMYGMHTVTFTPPPNKVPMLCLQIAHNFWYPASPLSSNPCGAQFHIRDVPIVGLTIFTYCSHYYSATLLQTMPPPPVSWKWTGVGTRSRWLRTKQLSVLARSSAVHSPVLWQVCYGIVVPLLSLMFLLLLPGAGMTTYTQLSPFGEYDIIVGSDIAVHGADAYPILQTVHNLSSNRTQVFGQEREETEFLWVSHV